MLSDKVRLLLLSNSSLPGQNYLDFAVKPIAGFLKEKKNILFFPFAAVTFSYEEYLKKVNEALNPLNLNVKSAHEFSNPEEGLDFAEAVMVGGGNTFELLRSLRQGGWLEKMKERCLKGLPYVGWSAGSNMACPTICTTNDMPITDPGSLNALRLIPFQINPHYTNASPPGHMGETRNQRLEEFITRNPEMNVLAIPEGTFLQVTEGTVQYFGEKEAVYLRNGKDKSTHPQGSDFGFLLS